jgi:MHS family proline/betaine transporter-like MFS transporter
VVAATIAGDVLEWSDVAVYGYFAVAIGWQCFPADDPTASPIAALGVFAAGFVARPLGGVLFGHDADRMGRQPARLASAVLMVVPTVLIGLLPAYAQIGGAAPALLLTLRLLQGLSVGGEYATSTVDQTGHAPTAGRGLVASTSGIGGMLPGSGVGALVSAVLHAEGVDARGWRIPFLLASRSAPSAWSSDAGTRRLRSLGLGDTEHDPKSRRREMDAQ